MVALVTRLELEQIFSFYVLHDPLLKETCQLLSSQEYKGRTHQSFSKDFRKFLKDLFIIFLWIKINPNNPNPYLPKCEIRMDTVMKFFCYIFKCFIPVILKLINKQFYISLSCPIFCSGPVVNSRLSSTKYINAVMVDSLFY